MVVKVTELVKTYQDFKEKVAPVAAAEIRRRIAEEEAQRIEIARREVSPGQLRS
jgi:hypothetical protein